ncbi:MAG: hypothetical protein J7K40_10000 [candidate division Zixibacteria bacterium]|nr:hypothetical protein [candidate division Zixibacteria bacterium]
MTEREKAYETALTILKKLTPEERGWLRQASIGGVEEQAFRDAYHTWMGEEWKETPEIIFIITEEDAQIIAKDILDRELTPEEMHVVKKGIESGLGDWSMVVSIAVGYAVAHR